MPEGIHKRALWLGIVQWAGGVLVTVIVLSFLLGGKRERVSQKVTTLEHDVAILTEEFKKEKQHITDMDLQGSVATKNFIANYDKKQAAQDQTIKEISDGIRHIGTIELRLDNLERIVRARKNIYDDDPPMKPRP